MAVVVTGAAGFIGGHLVAALAAAGHQVLALDRRPCAGLPPGTRSLRADLLEEEAGDALRDADAVFHLAGRPGVRSTHANEEGLRQRDNVVATAAVIAATRQDVPLVVTSSSSVYGGTRGAPSRESDPLLPQGGYARSKVAAEQLCAQRLAAGGAVGVARPFTVAGDGQRPDMALARWIDAISAGRPVTLLGGPARTRDITDVRDIVRGLLLLADRGLGRTVNLGTGVAHSLQTLLNAVCAEMGAPVEVLCETALSEEVADTRADTALCRRVLGFVPRTDLSETVRRQVAASRADELAVMPG